MRKMALDLFVLGLLCTGFSTYADHSHYISIEKAQMTLERAPFYAHALNQLRMATSLPNEAKFAIKSQLSGGLSEITLNYFYSGTEEVFGELSVTGTDVGGELTNLSEVTFTRLQ